MTGLKNFAIQCLWSEKHLFLLQRLWSWGLEAWNPFHSSASLLSDFHLAVAATLFEAVNAYYSRTIFCLLFQSLSPELAFFATVFLRRNLSAALRYLTKECLQSSEFCPYVGNRNSNELPIKNVCLTQKQSCFFVFFTATFWPEIKRLFAQSTADLSCRYSRREIEKTGAQRRFFPLFHASALYFFLIKIFLRFLQCHQPVVEAHCVRMLSPSNLPHEHVIRPDPVFT